MNDTSTIGGGESSPAPQPSSGISLKNAIIGGLVILVVGAAIGRFSLPAKVVTKTEIQTVTKTVVQTVVKTVVQKSVTDDKNKVTVITTTVKPDGSKVTTTTITDKSVISSESDKTAQSNTNAVTNTSQDIKSTTTTTYSKNNWQVSALASVSKPTFSNLGGISYGAEVDRRIIGPFSIGVFGLTDQTYGATLGISF